VIFNGPLTLLLNQDEKTNKSYTTQASTAREER